MDQSTAGAPGNTSTAAPPEDTKPITAAPPASGKPEPASATSTGPTDVAAAAKELALDELQNAATFADKALAIAAGDVEANISVEESALVPLIVAHIPNPAYAGAVSGWLQGLVATAGTAVPGVVGAVSADLRAGLAHAVVSLEAKL